MISSPALSHSIFFQWKLGTWRIEGFEGSSSHLAMLWSKSLSTSGFAQFLFLFFFFFLAPSVSAPIFPFFALARMTFPKRKIWSPFLCLRSFTGSAFPLGRSSEALCLKSLPCSGVGESLSSQLSRLSPSLCSGCGAVLASPNCRTPLQGALLLSPLGPCASSTLILSVHLADSHSSWLKDAQLTRFQ